MTWSVLYAVVALGTALRAAHGMLKVRGAVLQGIEPGRHGYVYLGLCVTACAMGLCWFLYWPALGAVYLLQRAERREDDD